MLRHRGSLSSLVVEIVNRFPTFDILNPIFDAIVTFRGQVIDGVLSYTTLEFDEDFRGAKTASLAERNVFDSHSFLLLFDGHEAGRSPIFPPFVELTGESGYENEDERQRDVDEDVVAVHAGTS